jgi:hypothetical protein
VPASGHQTQPAETRRISAVALIAGTEQATFPVSPKPFVYREGMRLRIDILGDRAYVAERLTATRRPGRW